ncbi:hypothetical protein JAZ75_05950 [Sphingobacterium sp. UDSM-2020]|nr:hypothetical protein JAZ75_05950 [Sphingobacterium sp. UDSM-2020]
MSQCSEYHNPVNNGQFPKVDQFSTQRVANLSWTNIRLIMRIDEPREREYYIKKATVDINSLFSPIVHLKRVPI